MLCINGLWVGGSAHGQKMNECTDKKYIKDSEILKAIHNVGNIGLAKLT